MLLENISSPKDINKLSPSELRLLAKEIRDRILEVASKNGGHVASNLGIIELTIALHKVFNDLNDAIIFDVSHQCYAHKLLTGRNKDFDTLRQHGGISGFTKRKESLYDYFDAGHASTSISSALGLLTGRKLLGNSGKVVAVIGDGALTGGMAFEALSHGGQLAKDLIVILNDNQMSISKNTGSLSRYLSRLTSSSHYQKMRNAIDKTVQKLPFINKPLSRFIFRFKRAIKASFFSNNLFVDFGFEYFGPFDGHNIESLTAVFQDVKKLDRPCVVHVVTKKGHNFALAENNPTKFHGIGPFSLETGDLLSKKEKTFTEVFGNKIVELGHKYKNLACITAAMIDGTGLTAFAKEFPNRFFDVGIAEEHAVTFAGGLARSGIKPVVAIYSTFMQRSVDQLIHDIALQKVPAVFVLDRAGPVPDDGETHQGIFDISLLRPIPDVSLLAPSSDIELQLCLEWACDQNFPVVIRYPKGNCPKANKEDSYPIECGKGVLIKNQNNPEITTDYLFVCTGGILPEVQEACKILKEKNIFPDIYNLRFLKPLDKDYFLSVVDNYKNIVFVEDGIRIGGIGTYLESLLQRKTTGKKTWVCGFPDKFIGQGKRHEILEDAHLSPQRLAKKMENLS